MKTCKIENCNSFVWAKGLCKNHTPRTPIKKTKSPKMGPGIYEQIRATGANYPPKDELYDRAEMYLIFFEIWKDKPHKSEVSGTYLGAEISTAYFHHILPKGKYPQAAVDKENIILLTFDEHTNVENDMYKYEEVNKKREALRIKYGL